MLLYNDVLRKAHYLKKISTKSVNIPNTPNNERTSMIK